MRLDIDIPQYGHTASISANHKCHEMGNNTNNNIKSTLYEYLLFIKKTL